MDQLEFFKPNPVSALPREPTSKATRTLKVEATGDFWKGLVKPKIRLMGRWLERAGFISGHRVHVVCISPGVIELRSLDDLLLSEPKPVSPAQPDCPF